MHACACAHTHTHTVTDTFFSHRKCFFTFNSGPHNPRIEAEVSCCRTGEVRKYSDLSEVVKTRVLSTVPVLPANQQERNQNLLRNLFS